MNRLVQLGNNKKYYISSELVVIVMFVAVFLAIFSVGIMLGEAIQFKKDRNDLVTSTIVIIKNEGEIEKVKSFLDSDKFFTFDIEENKFIECESGEISKEQLKLWNNLIKGEE